LFNNLLQVKREVSIVHKSMVSLLLVTYLFFALTYILHLPHYNSSYRPFVKGSNSILFNASNDPTGTNTPFHRIFKSVLAESNKTFAIVKKNFNAVSISVFPEFLISRANVKHLNFPLFFFIIEVMFQAPGVLRIPAEQTGGG
jgi:ammonia channel protein AmtB